MTEAGDLLMCGRGRFGRLGLGEEDKRKTPTPRAVFDGEAVLMVACGRAHTAVATEGGGVYTFGDGQDGLLGHGDFEDQLVPRRVAAEGFNDERVVMLAVRETHMVALSEEGHVFTWGAGDDGQLGHGDGEDQLVPRQVEPERFGGERVVFVAAGGDHTVAVTAGGRLYTWGDGHQGQLGHGSQTKGRDYYRQTPTLVWAGAFGGSAVMMAACGEKFTLVVTRDLTLWACGCGYDGQLGLSRAHIEGMTHAFKRVRSARFGEARIVAAAAGKNHSTAVTEDGALWTWGLGNHGQLGYFVDKTKPVPTLVAKAVLRGRQYPIPRIGRCRALSSEHALAFAMGMHGRLGAASPVQCLAGEIGLLRMIVGWCRKWVGGVAGREEGVVRLLGGGQMLDSVRDLADLPWDMAGPYAGSKEEESKGSGSWDWNQSGSEESEEVSVRFMRFP